MRTLGGTDEVLCVSLPVDDVMELQREVERLQEANHILLAEKNLAEKFFNFANRLEAQVQIQHKDMHAMSGPYQDDVKWKIKKRVDEAILANRVAERMTNGTT